MMPFDYKAEARRPVTLALAALAVLGWILFATTSSSKSSQAQRYRTQVRELSTAQQQAATQVAQLRLASGSLADVEAKIATATEQLKAANIASEQGKAQLAAVQTDIDTRLKQQAQLA